MLSMAVATGPAAADPTETSQPPAPSEPPSSEPAEPPPSSETSAPPTESPTASRAAEEPLAPAAAPLVEITASFDKPSYRTGEDMRIKFSVKNVGSGPLTTFTHVDFTGPDLIKLRSEDHNELRREVSIAAGATRTLNLVGKVGNPDITVARLSGVVFDVSGPGAGFEFTTPVTPRFGHAGGRVFGDENGNGRFDSGEALAGATLTITNQLHDSSTFTATSDAAGRFEFPRIPTAPYFFSGRGPDGWLIGFRSFTVDESNENDNLLVRAVRPLTDLSVDLQFTKEVYRPAERPVVRVTLKNSGNRPLTGIVANCDRSGEGAGLQGRGPGWGGLAGDGVTIGARQTKALNVSEEMPDNALSIGTVHVACDFSYQNVEDDTNPRDFDQAKVPGGFGDITGDIKDGETGIGGVRVVLVAPDERCPIVAEAKTDNAGHFELKRVPVGVYKLFMFPPAGWRIEHDNPTSTDVVTTRPSRLIIEAEPGSAPAPTLPTQPADCKPAPPVQPAPQGSAAPGLAQTGSNLLLPALAGLIIALAGAGTMFAARRRRA